MGLGDIVGVAALLVMIWLSRRAAHRLPPAARIPMQWGLDGKPTWTASRAVGLWFTPVLGGSMLGVIAALLRLDVPTTDATTPAIAVTVQVIVAASFVGAHFLHLRWALKQAA